MRFTFMAYNPSKDYQWTMHRTGCKDIQQELRGVRTDSGFPALNPEEVEADTVEGAVDKYLGEDMKEMGWDISAIRICPCCEGARERINYVST